MSRRDPMSVALDEVASLLGELDALSGSDPAHRLGVLEASIDLLNQRAITPSALGPEARRRLDGLRRACMSRVLDLLPVVGRERGELDQAKVLLFKLRPGAGAAFDASRRNLRLTPTPPDGATVTITPPGLAWLPMAGACGYRVEIFDRDGAAVYRTTVSRDPVHLPDIALAPGSYRWEVTALDPCGRPRRRRGTHSFRVPDGVPHLVWTDPGVLLDRIDRAHPRLLYPRRALSELRDTLETTRRGAWAACRSAAERALEGDLPAYPTYDRLDDPADALLEYRICHRATAGAVDLNLMNLSLAYLMTGNPRYGDPAKRILLRLAEWPTGDSDLTSVNARLGDEIGLSLARCAHRAYDWLHDCLDEAERQRVLAMCEQRAWQAYRRLKRHAYLCHPGESHNGRLVAYLVEMAIVMAGEAPGAKSWLGYALEALTTVLPHWGDDEGGWSEGPAYGVWQNQSFVTAFEALRMATGFDLWQRPSIRRFPYFLLYCSALRATCLPFGDGAEREGPGSPGGSAYGSLMRHFAHRFADPTLGWAAGQAQPALDRNRELSFLFEDTLDTRPPSDLPNARVFETAGLAALHSDLSRPDEDTFLLFKSSPRGSASKSHADHNGFCLLKGGTPLAIPSGYDGPAAGLPHHFEWTHSTKASNCVLVDGHGQAIQDRRATGRLVAFEDRRGLSYVAGDASAAYMGRVRRFVRHVLFLRPGLFVVLDELEAPAAGRFQWMLHSLERFEIDATAGQVISRRAGATLTVQLRSGAGLSLRQTDRFDTPYNTGVSPAYRVDVPNQWHLTAETRDATDAVRIAATMAVSGPRERFTWEPIEHPGWLGARATTAAGSAEGWAQIRAGAPGPPGYGASVASGAASLCGRDSRGDRFEAAPNGARRPEAIPPPRT